MLFDYPTGTYSIMAIPALAALLFVGWKAASHTPLNVVPQTIPSAELTDDADFTPPRTV
jgi:L-asparagine permease